MKLVLNEEWTVGESIGSGGFGAVREAENNAGVKAAVKLVRKQPGTEREMLFTNLAGIRNTVPVIDSGETDEHWVLVMPRAEKSLRAHLDNGPLPLGEAVSVLCDVAETLADLKDHDIVHRDLKPENILLLNGRWCLADFGIARYAEATTARQTFKFTGTFAYMAPERWKNQRATNASDIYALGILVHELLEGTAPFTGPEEIDFAEQHIKQSPPPLKSAPPLLAMLTTECLYKAPQARPAAGNVLARLQHIPTAALTGGLASLAEANKEAIVRQAEADRRASEHATEVDRRGELFQAAQASFDFISEEFLTTLMQAAPSAKVQRDTGAYGRKSWSIQIDDASLKLSELRPLGTGPWKGAHTAPAFDVIAEATVQLYIPGDHYGYQGRSHSLWYADARAEEQYQWFETAFMSNPFANTRDSTAPFALSPGAEAGEALSPVLGMHQAAWPFTPLVVGDLDEFISRWAGWFAQAAQGQLGYPRQLPERSPHGSWRK